MRTARLKPEGLTAHDFESDSPVDFLVGDFFAADFFAGAFLVVAFFAGAFLVVDLLVVVSFAADFSEAALLVGSLCTFGGAGVAGAAGGSDRVGWGADAGRRRRQPNHAATPITAATVIHISRRTRRR